MKITGIGSYINFGAGKTKILSDFDGTFMPNEFNHDVMCNDSPPVNREAFQSYFSDFKKFFDTQNKNEKKTELTISTGRNLYEYNYFMQKIKQKGLSVPNPDKLIIVNGGDEYVREEEDYFTSSRKDMFNQTDLSSEKTAKIADVLESYDPSKVKTTVRSMLYQMAGNPAVLEPMTHQGMYGYKDQMTLQEQINQLSNKLNYVSMRQDGDYQIRMTAPYGSLYIETLKEFPKRLEDKGYRLDVSIRENDAETFVNRCDNENVWSHGTSISMKPKTIGKVKVLDKYHHAKIMTDEIRKKHSNDLVVVCGDGSNDLDMLNLSNYSDKMTSISDFSNPKFKKEADKIPVIGIFVRNSNKLDRQINEFEEAFNFDGHKRFIVVDKNDPKRPSTLLDAIKLAQSEYSNMNLEYGRNL